MSPCGCSDNEPWNQGFGTVLGKQNSVLLNIAGSRNSACWPKAVSIEYSYDEWRQRRQQSSPSCYCWRWGKQGDQAGFCIRKREGDRCEESTASRGSVLLGRALENSGNGVEVVWRPRLLAQDDFVHWHNEEIQVPHGGWFCWPMLMAPLVYKSAKEVRQIHGGQLPRRLVVYDHAHRVMGWLGFDESEALFWWLLAYVAGDMRKLLFFVLHRSSGMVDEILRTVGPMHRLVQGLSVGRMPSLHPDACPPVEYESRSPIRKPKYPLFNEQLLSSKYRRGLMPEPLDPLTIEKGKAIAKYLKDIFLEVEYDPDKEFEESRLAAKANIAKVLEHPLYKIIHAAKFHQSRATTERLSNIAKLTRECHESEVSIGTLLEWNWRSEENKGLRLELAQAASVGQGQFRAKRREVANKIYKQVHGWFQQRGWPMPKCPENWREKIIKP
jgi:hypothetical protein